MQKALEIRKKDTRESCDGFLGIMLLYTEYGCHMHYRRILMKQFSKGIFLSVIAFSMVLGGGLFLVGPEGVQAVGVTGQPISSYFADPDLAELVATGKTPNLIKPFELSRFSRFQQVNEMGATAASH